MQNHKFYFIMSGDRVRCALIESKTTDRVERHNDVKGTLLVDLTVGGNLLIGPEFEEDSEKGLYTSMIQEIHEGNGAYLFIKTMNSTYLLESL